MSDWNQFKGQAGEDAAKDFLVRKGYRWIASNFRTRGGELDLVMEDGNTLVFVEVKKRESNDYGQPEEAITPWKIKHLTKAALLFIKAKGLIDKPVRFDVVTVEQDKIRHIPDAFEAMGNYYY